MAAALMDFAHGDFLVERNTFLDIAPPAEPCFLLRASTAPVSSGDETSSEPEAEHPSDPEAPIPDIAPAPPMLPLEFCETPDAVNYPEGTVTLLDNTSRLQAGSQLPKLSCVEESFCEKNTFLELKPPAPPDLARAKTEPAPGLDAPEPEAEGSPQFELLADMPPMLPLEFAETPNVFHDPHGVMGNISQAPPPGLKVLPQTQVPAVLPLEYVASPHASNTTDLVGCFAGPPPERLQLEEMQTFDHLEASRLVSENFCFGASFQPLHMESVSAYEAVARKQIVLEDVIPHSAAAVTFAQLPPPPAVWAPEMEEPPSPRAPAAAPREGAAAAPSPSELRPGALIVRQSEGGTGHVYWAVDGKKLFSTDVRIVSSQFLIDIPGEGPQPFKVTLVPKMVINNKRGGGFKKAKGKGSVVLKCEAEALQNATALSFTIRVGSGAKLSPPRGPVANNFTEQSFCGLPEAQEEWDFRSLVDQSDLLLVHLQIDTLHLQ